MMKSSAALSGSFVPPVQFEKLEIHKVFLRFSNFHSCQNLSLLALVDFIIGYLSSLTSQCSCRNKNIAPGGTRAECFCESRSTCTALRLESTWVWPPCKEFFRQTAPGGFAGLAETVAKSVVLCYYRPKEKQIAEETKCSWKILL